ncbi:MAG: 3-hydroxyacyl-CoA dehydrogenase NAD-binding domain-containing protein [Desulfobacca sp.]|uniref:3-hydroxyacyl-CoA dehydrogenase NAD-binding domain-containing protein n=1 Tax=Desulfobacca sp. TaxID=2067990 RepID=UPI00404AF87A
MELTAINKVLVLGAGLMGRQIAMQCALFDVEVTLYGRSEISLARARRQLQRYAHYLVQGGHITADRAARALARITLTLDPKAAADGVDLVSESVSEDLAVKRQVWHQFGPLLPAPAILTTNASVIFPSEIADASGRPERFLGWHFHQLCFIKNVVDVMPHAGTQPACVAAVAEFSQALQLQPIVLRKEHRGYVCNAMLVRFLAAALELAVENVASIEDIDRAWMTVMQTPQGPFGLMDSVGLDTVANILRVGLAVESNNPLYPRALAWLQPKLEQGHLGLKTGQGFYHYARPQLRRERRHHGRGQELRVG